MKIVAEISSILFTFAVTYLFYYGIGPRDEKLFFTRAEKRAWNEGLRARLGDWLVITGICGVLTSFATYLFLIGSAKLFGWMALATSVTICCGAFVTMRLTKPLMLNRRIAKLLFRQDQVASVIATLFWSPTAGGRWLSWLVKWTSLAVIFSIIWLECTAFVDLTFWLLGKAQAHTPIVLVARFGLLFASHLG
ncbi:MAG: hypothetical protein JO013_13350 [Alphaproteobacteria bacterium]|nr:hypothetical protein [Alphaproteobacteria bacterium]